MLRSGRTLFRSDHHEPAIRRDVVAGGGISTRRARYITALEKQRGAPRSKLRLRRDGNRHHLVANPVEELPAVSGPHGFRAAIGRYL